MEPLLELLLQFLSEVLLQVLFELGYRSLANTFKRDRNPVLSLIGYGLWGAIAGVISLWMFPAAFITNYALKVINLAATPMAAACLMALIGLLRKKNDREVIKLDHFGYAFVFALAMSTVRFLGAK